MNLSPIQLSQFLKVPQFCVIIVVMWQISISCYKTLGGSTNFVWTVQRKMQLNLTNTALQRVALINQIYQVFYKFKQNTFKSRLEIVDVLPIHSENSAKEVLKNQKEEKNDEDCCNICFSTKREVVFVPVVIIAAVRAVERTLAKKECPIRRKNIDYVLKTNSS